MNNKIVYSTNNLKKLREKKEKSIGLGTNFDISLNINVIQDSLLIDQHKTNSSKNFEDISDGALYTNQKSKENYNLNPLKKIIFKKDINTTETDSISSKNSDKKIQNNISNLKKENKKKKNLEIKNVKQIENNTNLDNKLIKTTRSTFSNYNNNNNNNNNKIFSKKNKNVKIKNTTESSEIQNTLVIKPKTGSFKFYIDSETQLINNLNKNNTTNNNINTNTNNNYDSRKNLNLETIKNNFSQKNIRERNNFNNTNNSKFNSDFKKKMNSTNVNFHQNINKNIVFKNQNQNFSKTYGNTFNRMQLKSEGERKLKTNLLNKNILENKKNYQNLNLVNEDFNKFRVKSPHNIIENTKNENNKNNLFLTEKYNDFLKNNNLQLKEENEKIFKKKYSKSNNKLETNLKYKEKEIYQPKPIWNHENNISSNNFENQLIEKKHKSKSKNKNNNNNNNDDNATKLYTTESNEDPEIQLIYNKIFDKYFRNFFDPKVPKTKEKHEQLRKYLKIQGNPTYIEDKIIDIKSKIFFLKGIIDFTYPKVLADKMKIQNEYYDKIANDNMEELRINNENKNNTIESQFYTMKSFHKTRFSKSSQNFYPRIATPIDSNIKLRTKSKNFMRNIFTPYIPQQNQTENNPVPNIKPGDMFSNLDKFFNMKNFRDNEDLITRNLLKNSKY